ncbi:hypothetical protein FACS1894122_00710 [Alphaproteobacteria bacterium]|nr:hypothetical protein FACS1894122_00710 [Alphaproteobacteria bacterium]
MFKKIKRKIYQFIAYCHYKKLYAGIHKYNVSSTCDKLGNILYINTLAGKGGAAEVAYNILYKGLSREFHTEIVVAENLSNDSNVNILPKDKTLRRIQRISEYQDFFYFPRVGYKPYALA